MAYCFLRLNKVKSIGELTARYNHNFRKREVENADPALRNMNEELVPLKDSDGTINDYASAFRKRTEGMKIRSNAVYAIEALTTFSGGVEIDLNAWKNENVKWLKDTFDHAGDGKENVVSVVYHGDESNAHCHAMIIPIDDKGHLCAKFYVNGAKKLSELQSSYAERMKCFGLERGLEGSSARHRDIRKFYAELNKAKADVPKPFEKESAEEYYNRSIEQLEAAHIAILAEKKKIEEEIQRKIDLERIEAGRRLMSEIKTKKGRLSALSARVDGTRQTLEETLSDLAAARKRLDAMNEKKAETEKEIHISEKKLTGYKDEVSRYEKLEAYYKNIEEKAMAYGRLIGKYEAMAETDPESALQFFSLAREAEIGPQDGFAPKEGAVYVHDLEYTELD